MSTRFWGMLNGLLVVLALLLAGCSAEPSQNVFDDMVKCDFIGFSDAVGATYMGEKFVLDDGFSLACEEDGSNSV